MDNTKKTSVRPSRRKSTNDESYRKSLNSNYQKDINNLITAITTNDSDAVEKQCLGNLLMKYGRAYSFSNPLFKQLLLTLTKYRLIDSWIVDASVNRLWRILQMVRVLTRDTHLLHVFRDKNGVHIIAKLLHEYTDILFGSKVHEDLSLVHDILVELASIMKRMAKSRSCQSKLFELDVPKDLVRLLYADHNFLLHAVLVACLGFTSSSKFVSTFAQYPILEPLMQLLHDSDDTFKVPAAHLLQYLLNDNDIQQEIVKYYGFGVFISFLGSSKSSNALLLSTIPIITKLVLESNAAEEFANMGIVKLILDLLNSLTLTQGNPDPTKVEAISSITLIEVACECITALARDNNIAYTIRKSNGIYILGQLLCQGLKNTVVVDNDILPAMIEILRSLRYLYGCERNRKIFKPIFPHDFFEIFVNIGNYVEDLSKYKTLAMQLGALSWKEKMQIIAAIQEMETNNHGKMSKIRNYELVELIGKGAFGIVYHVAHVRNREVPFAMKLLPISNGVIRSNTGDDVLENSPESVAKEVEILKQLKHPNIVRYYDSFREEDKICIIMEFIDGLSLVDYIKSYKDKSEYIPEPMIWKIFLGLLMGLSYLHNEKEIVHRDLHPGNVMIALDGQPKITDFGLAKKQSNDSVLKSVVGTINYSCPELMLQQTYTDKADVWSLGCILYLMVTQEPAFSAPNAFIAVKNIVGGTYAPITGPYSPLVSKVIQAMLTVEANSRPRVTDIAQMIAPVLLAQLDLTKQLTLDLQDRLKVEQENHRHDLEELTQLRRQIKKHNQAYLNNNNNTNTNFDTDSTPTDSSTPKSVENIDNVSSFLTGDKNMDERTERKTLLANRVRKGMNIFGSKSSLITLDPSRMRLIADPVDEILKQVHKLVFVSQLAPSMNERDSRRKILIKYKKHIFTENTKYNLKEEMQRLITNDPRLVDPNLLYNDKKTTKDDSNSSLTYAQLNNMLEELLKDNNYYS